MDKEGRSTGPEKQGREEERDLSPVMGKHSTGTFYMMLLFKWGEIGIIGGTAGSELMTL